MNEPKSSAEYVNRYGMKNIITSFRCSESLRERLFQYADAQGKDPSSIIREAIAEYLRARNTSPVQNLSNELNGWTAKSTKL